VIRQCLTDFRQAFDPSRVDGSLQRILFRCGLHFTQHLNLNNTIVPAAEQRLQLLAVLDQFLGGGLIARGIAGDALRLVAHFLHGDAQFMPGAVRILPLRSGQRPARPVQGPRESNLLLGRVRRLLGQLSDVTAPLGQVAAPVRRLQQFDHRCMTHLNGSTMLLFEVL